MIDYSTAPIIKAKSLIDEIKKMYNIDFTLAVKELFFEGDDLPEILEFQTPIERRANESDFWKRRVKLYNICEELLKKQFGNNIKYVVLEKIFE